MTNETKNTPGKWEIHERFKHSYAIITCDEDGSLQTEVAWLGRSSYISHEENLANARLISHAPELLDALEQMIAGKCADCDESFCKRYNCPILRYKQIITRTKGEKT